ncbi:hypothetical protein TNCV_769001 [Trichonephila clavipes]|nr:hypothetical protein TNCV_769001 [Trichonephila clavipes]
MIFQSSGVLRLLDALGSEDLSIGHLGPAPRGPDKLDNLIREPFLGFASVKGARRSSALRDRNKLKPARSLGPYGTVGLTCGPLKL